MKRNFLCLAGFILLAFLIQACSQPVTGEVSAAAAPAMTTEPAETMQLPTATPSPSPTPLPDCYSDNPPSFADFFSWTKVNDRPIRGHELWVDIYVNDLGKDNYISAAGKEFPTCAKIVKAHLAGSESDTITALTVMVKMPAGFDPDHKDWWWGMYDKDGKNAKMSGQVQVCIACHLPVAEQDYVFSKKVMDEINK